MTTTILTPTCHLTSISVICSHCRLTISSTRQIPASVTLSTSTCSTILDRYTERIRAFTVAIIATLSTLFYIHMSAFIIRNSSCADGVAVDIITGTASVLYSNGSVYNYTNVSRRAIANLLLNRNISLGFWINANLIDSKRVSFTQTYDALPAGC